jgi:hypothetical protein
MLPSGERDEVVRGELSDRKADINLRSTLRTFDRFSIPHEWRRSARTTRAARGDVTHTSRGATFITLKITIKTNLLNSEFSRTF